jgi:glycerol-3-phosphate dehydrogenase (NAD(P)+)
VVVASASAALAEELQSHIADETLRLYTNEDPVGVQVAGALKNVMAIAVGVLVGMELGTNAAASLLTRGLAEMARLGAASAAGRRRSPAWPGWATSS